MLSEKQRAQWQGPHTVSFAHPCRVISAVQLYTGPQSPDVEEEEKEQPCARGTTLDLPGGHTSQQVQPGKAPGPRGHLLRPKGSKGQGGHVRWRLRTSWVKPAEMLGQLLEIKRSSSLPKCTDEETEGPETKLSLSSLFQE